MSWQTKLDTNFGTYFLPHDLIASENISVLIEYGKKDNLFLTVDKVGKFTLQPGGVLQSLRDDPIKCCESIKKIWEELVLTYEDYKEISDSSKKESELSECYIATLKFRNAYATNEAVKIIIATISHLVEMKFAGDLSTQAKKMLNSELQEAHRRMQCAQVSVGGTDALSRDWNLLSTSENPPEKNKGFSFWVNDDNPSESVLITFEEEERSPISKDQG